MARELACSSSCGPSWLGHTDNGRGAVCATAPLPQMVLIGSVEGVLDVLPRLLQVGLALIRLAFGLSVAVAGHLAHSFLGLPADFFSGILDLVFQTHVYLPVLKLLDAAAALFPIASKAAVPRSVAQWRAKRGRHIVSHNFMYTPLDASETHSRLPAMKAIDARAFPCV